MGKGVVGVLFLIIAAVASVVALWKLGEYFDKQSMDDGSYDPDEPPHVMYGMPLQTWAIIWAIVYIVGGITVLVKS
ncbi:MAG: hypothetical protein LBO00_02450 [Zoogloeaceae bacterium]|nr:hypothetical protein [Zoogloeaceae bacterium]